MVITKCLPLILVLLAGCTTTARMTHREISYMQIDCTKKQEQLDFLRSQWPSDNERIVNGLMITSTMGFVSSVADGTYQERKDWMDGYLTSALRMKIRTIREQCHAYPPY
jgi:hypothetical protein